MSYCYCAPPAVGASGAIFGLVGTYAVYSWRHRRFLGHGKESLEHIGRVVILNMGWVSLQGALITGAIWEACLEAWLWHGSSVQLGNINVSKDGRAVFKDNAPILQLINGKWLR